MIRTLLAGLLALQAASPAMADAVSDLPAHWQAELEPTPAVNLDGLETGARDSIREARQRLHKALLEDSDRKRLADAWGELGALYQVHFVFKPADICYRNAMHLDPGNFRWNYYAGYLAAVTGRTELAVKRLQAARELDPGYRALLVRLADAYLDLNRPQEAGELYRQTLEDEGLESASHYGLGQLALLAREFDKAIDHFSRALASDPAATRIHYPLAQALRAVKRTDEARQHLEQQGNTSPRIRDPQVESLEALKDSSSVYFTRAMKAIRDRDYAAATDEFAAGLSRQPENTAARTSHARALYLSGKKPEAQRELDRVLAENPGTSLGLFLAGVLAEEAGDPARAEELYQQAIRLEPTHAGASFYLANIAYRAGRFTDAAGYYATSLENEPGNLPAWMAYAGTLQASDNPHAQRLGVIEQALVQFPGDSMLLGIKIGLLASSGSKHHHDEALGLAKDIAEREPLPQYRELLALAHAGAGDFEQASAIQEELIFMTAFSMPGESARLKNNLTHYRQQRLPVPDDLPTARLTQAPQFQAFGPFRDYPAPRPY